MCCRLGKRRTARVRKGLGTKEERGNSNPEAERIDYGLGTELVDLIKKEKSHRKTSD